MKTRILLARHGATVFSAEERFAGSSDIDLSDAGGQLARKLGERLVKVKIDAFYCSDMKRAVQTAMLVAEPHGAKPIGVVGLREIDHGSWEGKIHKDVEKKFPEDYAAWTADPFNVSRRPVAKPDCMFFPARFPPCCKSSPITTDRRSLLPHIRRRIDCFYAASWESIRAYRERIAQDLACLNILDFKGISHAEAVLLNDISHYGSPFETH